MTTPIPTVRSCMSPPLFKLYPDQDVFQAIKMLLGKGSSGAPVVDEQNHLLGILTEKDCLRAVSVSAYDASLLGGKVADSMSPVRVTIDPDMDVFAAVHLFLETNFNVLPVLEEGKIVGRVSRRDLLRKIRKWQTENIRRKRRDQQAIEAEQHRPSSIEAMQKMVGSHNKDQVAEIFHKSQE